LATSAYSASLCYVSFYWVHRTRALPSFPTRRSSELNADRQGDLPVDRDIAAAHQHVAVGIHALGVLPDDHHIQVRVHRPRHATQDRKSTRLNSSHVSSSYAVFCLKKKK